MLKLRRLWLYLIASLLWIIAGGNVLSIGVRAWLELGLGSYAHYIWLIVSLVFFGIFIFPRTARRNVAYLESKKEDRLPVYQCFKPSTWGIMIFMIALGIFLRNTSWVGVDFIAGFYCGLGSSLMLASRYYYQPIKASLERAQ